MSGLGPRKPPPEDKKRVATQSKPKPVQTAAAKPKDRKG